MALARGRRNAAEFNYWPGFVDALSTLVLAIVFLLSVFLVVQFYLSQEVTGKDKALEQLNAKLAQLSDLLSLEKLSKLNLDEQLSQMRAGPGRRCSRTRPRQRSVRRPRQCGKDAAGRANELDQRAGFRKAISSRALAQVEVLNQQISALRRQLAALEDALDASEKQGRESQGTRRRSRPAAERRVGAARAGTVALSLRILRPAARDPRQSPGCPHRRRPLRVPVGSLLRYRAGASSAGRPRRTRQGRIGTDRTRQENSGRNRLGDAGRRAHRRAADHQPAVQVELGVIVRARDLGRAISRIARVPPQRLVAAGFAEFQPLDTDKTRRRLRRNRRIELKLTER